MIIIRVLLLLSTNFEMREQKKNLENHFFSFPKHLNKSSLDDRIYFFTWNTVTRAHSKESKFFLSHCVLLSSIFEQNLHPNRFIPKILFYVWERTSDWRWKKKDEKRGNFMIFKIRKWRLKIFIVVLLVMVFFVGLVGLF